MKNFTNNFKQFTSRLSARWLIMALMLLVGTSSAWANGFWGVNAWNIKFYSPDQNKDMWINDNYDSGHGASATIDLGTFTSAPCLKGYWAKTWGYGNDTNKYVKVTFNNTTTNSGVSKQWDSNGDQMWKSESLDIKFPDTEGSHEESITFAINEAETMTCKIKYKICTSCCTNYYVAGDAGLCSEGWNASADKMDCDNNVWTKKFTNINKGTYYFQITDGTWNVKKGEYDNSKGNIPLSNEDDGYGAKKIKLTTTSKGDITISFDGENAWVNFEQPCYSSSDVEPGTISSNATNNTICGSGTVTLTLSNTTTKDGLTKSIQWQKQSGNAWSNINNATSTTYTTENLSATTKYRAKVTWKKTGCTDIVEYANEGGFTVTVNALPPEIITPVTSLNPASGILCSGSQAKLTVTNPQNDYTYTLMYKGTAQGEPISGNNEVEFTVIEAGSYSVQAKVQSNSGCTSTASSSASQIKVIATDIKFDATEYTTTPWVPVTVVIEVPSGYEFTYNDATLTSITPEADKPIKKENGHEYTYTFPRPTDWGIGNSQSGDGYDEKTYTITATIKNAEQCGTAAATVKLQDEGNDNCTLPNQ